MREVDIRGINLDIQVGLIAKVRPCKSIMPRDTKAVLNTEYLGLLPRIVKINFKVPANWKVVEVVKEGQILEDLGDRKLVHTCQGYYDECVRGFWSIWEAVPSK